MILRGRRSRLPDRYLIAVSATTGAIVLGMILVRNHIAPVQVRETSILRPSQEQFVEVRPLEDETPREKEESYLQVARVIDGDTLRLSNGERVRLIGVDAPETHHPEVPVQRFGEEATEFLRQLAEGSECTLEFEPGGRHDKYGRLLAYVYVGGKLVNAELISRGYAYAYTRFPFSRQAEFVALEREARERQYGLWNLSLRDGRIANLVNRYDTLSLEGRRRLDEIMVELIQEYPSEQMEEVAADGN